jgi:hypothetical protein
MTDYALAFDLVNEQNSDGPRAAGEPARAPFLLPCGRCFLRHAPRRDWGRAFGTLPQGLDTQAIVDRARINREVAALRTGALRKPKCASSKASPATPAVGPTSRNSKRLVQRCRAGEVPLEQQRDKMAR